MPGDNPTSCGLMRRRADRNWPIQAEWRWLARLPSGRWLSGFMLMLDSKLTAKATEVAGREERAMTKRMGRVICDITISADGYSAGLNQTEERPFGDDGGDGWGDKLHAWLAETPEENQAEVDS
jgi:hypothetical protein